MCIFVLQVVGPCEEGERDEMLSYLSSLTCVLTWQVRVLLTGCGWRKKARQCVHVEQLDHMLLWCYRAASHLYTCHPRAQVRGLAGSHNSHMICSDVSHDLAEQGHEVLVCVLVAIEQVFGIRLTCHGYPSDFTSMVC